ncbi:CaiB/BaiF CoA transferase family protein [Pseudonocardia endophytica]|uniref:Crotonobetainyl-CoA:carnitine CoA-transferase CaiB-like acyl-CoA transferase n=1 Tax=Pseudonocardia endophytica TaxID=401976 RepID=A0A4V2PIL9_PSEEN|nr:CoA transferase [Pseudonocardia endophytica]TCK25206.1 crotonobetainyl-CoA:carnitine CoA-transferase CaiB-like acyl-CoA transferase [Pseudonocardia endophytica]
MTGPLRGMRVLDLSQQLPGPYATFLLAGLGATVTKVEPPSGDAARHLDPELFANVNAGKASVVLDLKSDDGRARLLELARESDVVVEGFRPGVTARLGCDAATLHAIRPELVYCSVSGAGQTGPLAGHPTHDLSLQAMAGAISGDVTRIGVPWVDLATGTSAALAITAAWHAGGGAYLDMSMLDAAVAWTRIKPAGLEPGPEPTYGTLVTSDGERVVVALLEDAMWRRLCAALGWTDWVDDERLARYVDRRTHGAEIRQRLERDVATMTLDEVVALAEQRDLPLGPADATADPVAREQIATRFPSDGDLSPLPAVLLDRLGPAPRLDS